MMSAPRISVIMPARNAAATIRQAVASVLAQSCEDWELIVVDDGSTDGTAALAGEIGDTRIRIIRQPWEGVSAARNRAAGESRGDLLAFLDADDLYAPSKLERQAALLDRQPAVGSTYCAHRRIDDAGVPWTVHVPARTLCADDFLRGFPFNPSAHTVRREWHWRVGGFSTDLTIHEDRDYWLRLARAGCRFERTAGVLADYRLGPPLPVADPQAIVGQALRVIEQAAEVSPDAARQARFDVYQEWAFQSAVHGHSAHAQTYLGEMVRLKPDLLRGAHSRDDVLQAAVDLAVRARGDHEPLVDAIFAEFRGAAAPFDEFRTWAIGCGWVQRAVREALWNRAEQSLACFEKAAAAAAVLDERTARLLRHQCVQFGQAYGGPALSEALDRIGPGLKALAPRWQVYRLRNSIERVVR